MKIRIKMLFLIVALLGTCLWTASANPENELQGDELLAALEEKTNEFFGHYANKRFEKMLSMLSGDMKAFFEKFVKDYQKNPKAMNSKLPRQWNIMGSSEGKVPEEIFCYADVKKEYKFDWQKGTSGWTMNKMERVKSYKVSLNKDKSAKVESIAKPIYSLHFSNTEQTKITKAANKIIGALRDWRVNDFLALVPEGWKEDFVKKSSDKKWAQKEKSRYFGARFHIESIQPGERIGVKQDSEIRYFAHLELFVEHKDSSLDFTMNWKLQKIKGQWRLID
ncbi:MAG: hypothetical protein KAT34_01260 [Candidatus Aminicenantes bacterium]|nr:hypothetical protein [Candidatus Aminicenantes bacterium]